MLTDNARLIRAIIILFMIPRLNLAKLAINYSKNNTDIYGRFDASTGSATTDFVTVGSSTGRLRLSNSRGGAAVGSGGQMLDLQSIK